MPTRAWLLLLACGCTESSSRPGIAFGDGGAGDGAAGDGAAGSAEGAVGEACETSDDCPAGPGTLGVCLQDFPEGYCSAGPCADDADCPGGADRAACVPGAAGAPGSCLARCEPGGDDCRKGYFCGATALGEGPVCLPFSDGPTDPAVGDGCQDSGDCPPGGFCVTEKDFGAPGGYCIVGCQDGACPAGSRCFEADDGSLICLDECDGLACEPGRVCYLGLCVPHCDGDDDLCGEGRRCGGDGGCRDAGDPPGDGAVGSECRDSDDCADGGFCVSEEDFGAPGGYCIVGCEDQDCPDGARCITGDDGERVCLAACDGIDCRDGTLCYEGVCVPYCDDHDQCGGDRRCGIDGACRAEAGPDDPEAIGQACGPDGGCEGGFCLPEEYGFPGGYCLGGPCAPGDPESCPEGSVCLEFDDGSACWASCAAASVERDCAAGQRCLEMEDDGLCYPELPAERLGGACAEPLDCPGGICAAAWPGGGACLGLCAEGSPCPGDTPCLRGAGDPIGVCLAPCVEGACREGYACQDGACWPVLDPARIGGPCADAFVDCPGGFCLSEQDSGYPDGLCTRTCGPGGGCPGQTACAALGFGVDVCVAPCDGEDDCRAGTDCVAGACRPD